MGHKSNPYSLRLGIIDTWESKWFANTKNFKKLLHEDLAIKKVIHEKLKSAGVTRIEILRSPKKVNAVIHAAKPGLIIGRQGVAVEDLRDLLSKKFNTQIEVNIVEIPNPDMSAILIAENIAVQIEKRFAYRRAVKMGVQKAMEAGAKGVKIQVGGRLNGVEISRTEFFKEGNIPLHTLRADIDYARGTAFTTYGAIGIKVWIYKGMVFGRRQEAAYTAAGQGKSSAKQE